MQHWTEELFKENPKLFLSTLRELNPQPRTEVRDILSLLEPARVDLEVTRTLPAFSVNITDILSFSPLSNLLSTTPSVFSSIITPNSEDISNKYCPGY